MWKLCNIKRVKFATRMLLTKCLFSIIQYGSTVYKDHEGLGFIAQKHHPNQLDIYFVTSRKDWLGIAKPKNVFRSAKKPSTKLI